MTNTDIKHLILRKHAQGYTPTEISTALKQPVQLVRDIIRYNTPGPTPSQKPRFIQPPAFN